MIWATVGGKKTAPKPGTHGVCPLCTTEVIPKCGPINVWHWAHVKKETCDYWHEPESYWHKHWKVPFGKECSEVVITKDGKKHIADILTKDNVVIELQNSKISTDTIKAREDFYGERMIWLLNGDKIKDNLTPKSYWVDVEYIRLKNLKPQPVLWRRRYPPVEKGYNGEFFSWKNPRPSWLGVQRPVFIDFGDDRLFRVKEGMGTSQIRGTYVPKEKFIEKYGGDYEQYCKRKLEAT